MAFCMSDIWFGHIQPEGRKPWPNLLKKVKKSPSAAADIKKSQFALIPASKDFTELG